MPLPSQWNLRAQIGTALVVLTTVAALATATVFFRAMSEQLSSFEQARLEREADLLSLDWRLRLEGLASNVEFLTRTPPIAGLDRAHRNGGLDPEDGSTEEAWVTRLETIFRSLMLSHSHYLQVRLIGFEDGGRELVRAQRSESGSEIMLIRGEQLQEKGAEPYMIQALEEAARSEVRTVFSEITLNRELGAITQPATPMLRAMAVARGEGGRPYGVIVVNIGPSGIFDEQVGGLVAGRTYIVTNPRGQVLYDSNQGAGFAFEYGEDPGLLEESAALAALLNASEGLAAAADPESSVLEAARIAALPGSTDAYMTVLVRAGREGARGLARSTLGNAAVPIVLILLVTLLVGLFLGSRATQPFVELSSRISRIGEKGQDARLPIPSAPEAALVAIAFNRANRELAATVRELRRSNRELEEFAAVASHDLQEPARTVRSFASLLNEDYADRLDDDGREMLGFLVAAGTRMQEQIRELLTYSRIGQNPERAPVDCHTVLAEVEDDLAAAIADSGARISYQNLPKVFASEREIRLLFQNLIANAIKFRRDDVAPVISVRVEADDVLHFVVSDNGVGIPEASRDRVFDLFKRGYTERPYPGNGIGLTHCRKIVESHGGRIWIGDPEVGTEIHFTLEAPGGETSD